MIVVRSLAFHVGFFGWLALLSLPYTVMLLGPREWMQAAARLWVRVSLFLLAVVGGVRYELRGAENLPRDGAAIVVAKHQSLWDTLIFHALLSDPIYVLKEELARLPFFGWFVMKSGCVAVDRGAGTRALRQMAEGAGAALRRGSQVVIFPEGTRTRPGTKAPYHSGVALLIGQMDRTVPVVPVALNSGLYWGRRAFRINPGTIVIEVLPPVSRDLDRKGVMREIESRIETASRRLLDEAVANDPALAAAAATPPNQHPARANMG